MGRERWNRLSEWRDPPDLAFCTTQQQGNETAALGLQPLPLKLHDLQ